MAWDHALLMQTSHNIYLFMASSYSKYAIYIVETEPITASRGRGSDSVGYRTLQGQHLLWSTNKENKKLITLSIVKSKLFYIFPPLDLLRIVCIINI